MTTNAIARRDNAERLEKALIQGDLSSLSPAEKLDYYRSTCESLGLNPYTKPFEYLRLGNREVLYARRDATDQLRKLHRVTLHIVGRERIEDVYVVTARATLPDGRTDESTGAVAIGGLKGDSLANALMKAETKAKRRVTLSICGLGWLDETEIETIPNARSIPAPTPASEATANVNDQTVHITTGEIVEDVPAAPPGDRSVRMMDRYCQLCQDAERLGAPFEELNDEWTEEILAAKGKLLAATVRRWTAMTDQQRARMRRAQPAEEATDAASI